VYWEFAGLAEPVACEHGRVSTEGNEYVGYRQDAQLLSEIGKALDDQPATSAVSIPQHLASAAIAAWNRDDPPQTSAETPEQKSVRYMAADLALIGLTLSVLGEPGEDGTVRAQIDSDLIKSAIAASRLIVSD
jgi:hypothetical protein